MVLWSLDDLSSCSRQHDLFYHEMTDSLSLLLSIFYLLGRMLAFAMIADAATTSAGKRRSPHIFLSPSPIPRMASLSRLTLELVVVARWRYGSRFFCRAVVAIASVVVVVVVVRGTTFSAWVYSLNVTHPMLSPLRAAPIHS